MTTQSIIKTRFFTGTSRRDPHWSSKTWRVEPFDEQRKLWTLGQDTGFFWTVVPADPDSPRCRTVPRDQGVQHEQSAENEAGAKKAGVEKVHVAESACPYPSLPEPIVPNPAEQGDVPTAP